MPAAVVAKMAGAVTSAEAANLLSVTPGQAQRIAGAAGLSMQEVARVLEEFAVARALHAEVRIWRREGRPLPKTPTGLKEFLDSAIARIKSSQVRPREETNEETYEETNGELCRVLTNRVLTNEGRCRVLNPPHPTQASGSAKRKTGANDPCPCGSGRKYKRCHGA